MNAWTIDEGEDIDNEKKRELKRNEFIIQATIAECEFGTDWKDSSFKYSIDCK
jgi:hypothetical protein